MSYSMRRMVEVAWLTAGAVWAGAAGALAAEERAPSARPPVLKTAHGEVEIFPADNAWNTRVDRHKVHPKSAEFIRSVGESANLHPDFGTVWNGAPAGIPYVVVGSDQPRVPVRFEYPDESDPGPYPVPLDAPIEGGPKSDGDRHILVIDPKAKKLYELFSSYREGEGYRAGSGAVFDLTSNRLRPAGWTSADAAGLPIFPGLVRYDEVVELGEIRHALRFTVKKTQRGYVAPATHWASASKDRSLPPMGLRVRLRADYDISRFPKSAQVILTCLKRYGMLLADNGGNWFISGAPDARWDVEELATLKRVKGKDLEVVDTGEIVIEGK